MHTPAEVSPMSYSTAWEIPPDKVHGLGCTLGDGVNMVIPGKFTTDVQAEIFGILCRVYDFVCTGNWFGFLSQSDNVTFGWVKFHYPFCFPFLEMA